MEDGCPYLCVGNKDVVFRLKSSAKGDKIRRSQRKHSGKAKQEFIGPSFALEKKHTCVAIYVCTSINYNYACTQAGRCLESLKHSRWGPMNIFKQKI